jgi:hypothetical protein
MNSGNLASSDQNEEEKIDKSLRRMKPIQRKDAEPASPTESLHTDSEDDEE